MDIGPKIVSVGRIMGTTPDRRVRRTQQALESALLSLIVERGYEPLTVREIIDRADVGRSTFYAHYTDKQDLLVASLDRIEQLLLPEAADTPRGVVDFNPGLFAAVAQQRDLYRSLTPERNVSALVHAHIQRLLSDALRDRLIARLPTHNPPPVPLEAVVRAMVGAYMALLSGWINDDIAPERPPAQMETLFQLIAGPAITASLDLDLS